MSLGGGPCTHESENEREKEIMKCHNRVYFLIEGSPPAQWTGAQTDRQNALPPVQSAADRFDVHPGVCMDAFRSVIITKIVKMKMTIVRMLSDFVLFASVVKKITRKH